jgi:hypothetical protein
VEFLVEQGYWPLEKRTINCTHFNFKGTIDKVIAHIENNSLEGELRRHTGDCWLEREESVKINRKRRF